MCERIRSSDDRQRIPLHLALGSNQPKLTEAVTLMEANIEEPISLDELSSYVGISRRQLERLFQKHLNCVPTRYSCLWIYFGAAFQQMLPRPVWHSAA
jgi:transcriptional regulator GlxA family with amidase domain